MYRASFIILWIFFVIPTYSEDLPLDTPCQRLNLEGTCILARSCDFTIQLIYKHKDIQTLKLLSCGFENIIPKVCCPKGNISLLTTENATIYYRTDDHKTPMLETTTRHDPIVNRNKLSIFPPRSVCGKQTLQDRIVGGEITLTDEFPWLVNLKLQLSTNETKYACIGSLITNQHVLTAAHCLNSDQVKKLLSVRLGEWDVTEEKDCYNNKCSDPPVDRNISRFLIHPNFNMKADPTNDIAIIYLDQPVNFTDFIKPICLPTTPYIARHDYTNNNKYVTAGWGMTEYGEMSDIKRKVTLNAVSYNICRAAWKLEPDPSDPFIICAGGEINKDTCRGDSGGPLIGEVVEEYERNWYLFGITSAGASHCGAEGFPGQYTRVSKYMDWIIKNIL